ncbi:amino acid permease [Burkholderia lata]|uniref:Amino acid/polyamine/organocation transporter, APC superfamily n=1 Tax=Burkholderia lata (strain ATCC 17760 / DSM 23089 / LMG 22485 / NCIMB 9086 / R18194 / 383) TaxID=482957 RepID=Q39LI4_BURL3|nr:amino acid permease [Burkholderia lata]ABB06682.1 amino acid/polyamine/organocation transporter, APC superfamily [Burkholderia lata]
MNQRQGFDAIVEREKGLHRGLSTGQLSMIAIGGAIGTGLFLGSGFAIGFAGPSVLVSYAIGALIALLLMGCLAEMTVAHPTSGSFGAYAEHYVSPWAGFLVRYAYWASIVFAVGTEVTAIAVYMKYWFPAVPGWYWIVGFSAALIGINLVSVKVFGAVEYVFSMLKIAAIVAFIALGAVVVFGAPAGSGIGFANYTAHGGFFPKGVWGMWVAVIVSIFSYLSIEMIAVAAGEARDPHQAITRAFRATMVRLVFFYLLTLALMLAIVPWTAAGADESPFVKVMAATHVPGAAGVINFVILVAALSAMNSQLYITTRMMFSLSRAGYAPKALGRLTGHGVPAAALGLSAIGIALATVLNVLYPDTSFVMMMSVSMFGAMFTWLMIFVTHLFFRRHHRGQVLAFRMWGFPVTSLLGAALMFAALVTTYFTREFRMTLFCGVPFMIVLSVVYAVWYRGKGAEPAAGREGVHVPGQ